MGFLKFDVPNSLPVEDAKKRVEARNDSLF